MEERLVLLAVTLDDYNLHHSHFSLKVIHNALSAAPTPDPCFKFRINLAESWKPRFSWCRNVDCCFQVHASQYFSSLVEIHDEDVDYIWRFLSCNNQGLIDCLKAYEENWNLRSAVPREVAMMINVQHVWSAKLADPLLHVCKIIQPHHPRGTPWSSLGPPPVQREHNAWIEPIQRLNAPLSDWGVQQEQQ